MSPKTDAKTDDEHPQTHHDTTQDESNAADQTSSTAMELNLRLDSNGRTTFDPSLWTPSAAASPDTTSTCDNESSLGSSPNKNHKRAKTEAATDVNGKENNKHEEEGGVTTSDPQAEHHQEHHNTTLDYSSKTIMTNLAKLNPKLDKELDDLLFDCEITDCGLLPRTFWVPATGVEPRCYLEKMALEIFNHHVPQLSSSPNFFYDCQTSGAEWWVQLRPSPPGTGRYSMLADPNDDDENDMAKSGISFHWDKDEDLRQMCGGSMYIHPHISTVTYLTNLGCPTMVFNKRVDPLSGEHVVNNEDCDATEGFLSWPKRGKHLSFDGRFLHAAPSDLMEAGAFERQCKYIYCDEMDEKTKKSLGRSHRRVTFLVNIWLNYKPFNVDPFPETMISNLSKVDLLGDFTLFGNRKDDGKEEACSEDENLSASMKTISVRDGKAVIEEQQPINNGNSVNLVKMTWPMGSCEADERIEVPMPLDVIRSQGVTGSDVALSWKDGVVLTGTGA